MYTVIEVAVNSNASSCNWSLCAITHACIAMAFTTVIRLAKGEQNKRTFLLMLQDSLNPGLRQIPPDKWDYR